MVSWRRESKSKISVDSLNLKKIKSTHMHWLKTKIFLKKNYVAENMGVVRKNLAH